MKEKQLFLALNQVDDRFLDIADSYRLANKETGRPRNFGRRALMGLLAAAICVSLLAVTAVAAGWVPGIFKSVEEQDPEYAELFEAAAQANTEISPEVVAIPQVDLTKFVLLEKYYDGETILLGYNLDKVLPAPVVGFQPDEEFLKTIKWQGYDQIGWADPDGGGEPLVTENAKKYHLREGAFTMEEMMKSTLSDEEYKRAWEILESQGWICLVTQNVWLSDHVDINGHDHIEGVDPSATSFDGPITYNTEYGDCLRLGSLPKEGRNQDSVTVTLKVRSGREYWYMDLEGNARTYYDQDIQTEEVSFQIDRTEKEVTP